MRGTRTSEVDIGAGCEVDEEQLVARKERDSRIEVGKVGWRPYSRARGNGFEN